MARYGKPRKIRVENLEQIIKKMLNDLKNEMLSEVGQEIEAYGEELTKKISEYSQAGFISGEGYAPKKRTGRYARGWRLTKLHIPGGVKYIVHNATAPELTSLLEKGHVQHGENSVGYVRGLPHIRPAFDETAPAFIERVKERLGGK